MAETQNEKMGTTTSHTAGSETPPSYDGAPEIHHPAVGKPWMYKTTKIGPITIPGYATPEFQLVFVALVCFLCPGMFNAVNGLGAGGLVDPHDINRANTAVYATFSIVGFFAGSVANAIGLRLTLGLGGVGYCVYVAAILCYNHTGNAGFLIFSGVLLGSSAGLLWCAQGAVMMAYPTEGQKGRFISWFWMIFNLGAVIGALIPLGQNISNRGGAVNDGTYIAFIVLMASGFILAGFLCNPHYVQRKDGSHVILMKNPTWKSEFIGMFETFKSDWYIVFLFPFFFSSNWFYTYHFQDINAARFNIRTRALNSVLYWTSQIIGAGIFGFALDSKRFSRSMRAKACIVALFVLTFVIWGGGYDFQRTYTREEADANKDNEEWHLDWTDSGYIGPMFLYMFYGMFDAAWQTSAYWLMGSLTNNGRKLANFAGFYKGIQSAGGAISPAIDTAKVAYMTQFAVNWGMLAGSLVIAAPVIWMKVKDTTDLEEDLKFTDETKADVLPAGTLSGADGKMSEKVSV